jgi:hypothetical protein
MLSDFLFAGAAPACSCQQNLRKHLASQAGDCWLSAFWDGFPASNSLRRAVTKVVVHI